jgi:hypothetical protein
MHVDALLPSDLSTCIDTLCRTLASNGNYLPKSVYFS